MSNQYDLEDSELSNDEILEYYITMKIPVFLHGPSGVGKSQRVREIDPDFTQLVLSEGMIPEDVYGVFNKEENDYMEPRWYKELCRKCAAEPDKMHVLFIDELTNVGKPQAYVFDIVCNRYAAQGRWVLPDNCSVVAAGNESSDSSIAHPLTGALFRRFSHLYYKIDYESWCDWAYKLDKSGRPRIHPAIIAFISTYKDRALFQTLDEDEPKIVTDPRKWEQASKILYLTGNIGMLEPAIGEELTKNFRAFIKNKTLTPEDVINGNVSNLENIIDDFGKKMSAIYSLSNVDVDNLNKVLDFVEKNFEQECVESFKVLWIKGDQDRADYLYYGGSKDLVKAKEQQKDKGRVL